MITEKLSPRASYQHSLHQNPCRTRLHDNGTTPYGTGLMRFGDHPWEQFSCDRNAIDDSQPAAQVLTRRLRSCNFASAPRSPASWRAIANCSTGIARTYTSMQTSTVRSARSSHSCRERDDDAERATVMAAARPSWRQHDVEAALEGSHAGGLLLWETPNNNNTLFACHELRIAVSADAEASA